MNKIILGIVAFVVVISGIVVAVVASDNKMSSQEMGNMGDMSGSQNVDAEAEDLTNQSEVMIDIKDFAFSKKSIKIKAGTKVTWTNRDTVKHNAFSDKDNGPKGKLLAQGESFSFVFKDLGVTDYYCTPHPYMKGVVNVVQ